MASVINTNISSLNAQRNLTNSQASLATSIQRLSSGLRINSAKDDAAGLAISDRFTSQINGLNQAASNANDGISLAQTAEGALSQVTDSLQRVRELAVQSANATNSSSDRAALQQEVSQLVSEISRIGNTTTFNGLKILDGSYTNQQYQIGANAGDTLSVSVADSRASQLGATTLTSSAGVDSGLTIAGTAMSINGTAITTTGVTTMSGLVDAINAQTGTSGVTAARSTTNTFDTGVFTAVATGKTAQLTINGTAISFSPTNGDTAAHAAVAINNAATQTGVTASVSGGHLVLASANGADFKVQDTSVAADSTNGVALTAGVTTTAKTYTAGLTLSAKLGSTITATGALAAAAATGVNLAGATQVDLAVSTIDISSVSGANSALAAVDAALTQVSSTRAQLGAVQNRFTAVISNLSTASENASASRSRILDTDFAAETANLTRGQILQQAGTAMLAQANSLPNTVLTLLKG
jgi:flagellin